jgi:HlyD family secretion protein
VHVVDQGQLKAVNVQLGITDNRNSEVLGGELKVGERVVVGENAVTSGGKPSSVGMRLF